MKKIILLSAMMMLGGFFNITNADPCAFGNLGVDVKTSYVQDGKCVIVLDFYFDISHNSGGKYFWIHIWPAGSYTGGFTYNKPPTLTTTGGGNGYLQNSILTFGFYHQGSVLQPLNSYSPDATVTVYSGYTISEITGATSDRYTVKGLTIELPQNCSLPQNLIADAWESQAAQSQTVACFSTNVPFYVNDPGLRGFLFCQTPRTYTFEVFTISQTDMNINYKVVIDNGDGVYNATSDNIIVNNGTALLNTANNYRYISGIQGYLPYSNQKPEADRSLWVVVTTASRPNEFYTMITNACTPLPVQWVSFNARRQKENVTLAWATAMERNNRGFYIERKHGNDVWEVIGFVASQKADGSSDEVLFYNFLDYNIFKDVTFYRIRQVDIDNKASYSEVRMVNAFEQYGNIRVFPNPSTDGQLNIQLENIESGATIRLIDMNGKLVKEWNNVVGNKLSISKVPAGMYTLRVWIKGVLTPLKVKVTVM